MAEKPLLIDAPESVYYPQEDSFLLAKAVEEHAFGRVLDLGTGSGIQAITAALSTRVSSVLGVDVNPDAIACAEANAERNGVELVRLSFLQSDLFGDLSGQLFDTIVFNPPYLPTLNDERVKGGLNAALDGGPDGRRVTDAFIRQVKTFLKPGGIVLLVSSSLASSNEDGRGNEETVAKLEAAGFSCQVLSRQKFFFEELVVIKASLL